MKGTFKVDPSKDPRAIDMEVTETKGKAHEGRTSKGIYAFDGETLKWCSVVPATRRSTDRLRLR